MKRKTLIFENSANPVRSPALLRNFRFTGMSEYDHLLALRPYCSTCVIRHPSPHFLSVVQHPIGIITKLPIAQQLPTLTLALLDFMFGGPIIRLLPPAGHFGCRPVQVASKPCM